MMSGHVGTCQNSSTPTFEQLHWACLHSVSEKRINTGLKKQL
jgi:hypothetical protein